jgi:hypothetical protein
MDRDGDTTYAHYRQDVEPVLDRAKALRNDGLADKGIKNDFWHYGYLPAVVILELRAKYGLNVFDKNHVKRVFEVVNRDYPHLKTTDKIHVPRH